MKFANSQHERFQYIKTFKTNSKYRSTQMLKVMLFISLDCLYCKPYNLKSYFKIAD